MADGVAGIVLAGGLSSRMGTNKALLSYRGRPLVEHMRALLRDAGCEAHISGTVPGYDGIPDPAPHEGPARAITALLRRFDGRARALLFVPVDMPLLTVEALKVLLAARRPAFFQGFPLPAVLEPSAMSPESRSVRGLLESCGAAPLALLPGMEAAMTNTNTKEEWEAVAS
jgi:molybdopterin-guanine dinucleotide biosynthesis protein A